MRYEITLKTIEDLCKDVTTGELKIDKKGVFHLGDYFLTSDKYFLLGRTFVIDSNINPLTYCQRIINDNGRKFGVPTFAIKTCKEMDGQMLYADTILSIIQILRVVQNNPKLKKKSIELSEKLNKILCTNIGRMLYSVKKYQDLLNQCSFEDHKLKCRGIEIKRKIFMENNTTLYLPEMYYEFQSFDKGILSDIINQIPVEILDEIVLEFKEDEIYITRDKIDDILDILKDINDSENEKAKELLSLFKDKEFIFSEAIIKNLEY